MSTYMESTTAVTDASGHVHGQTEVMADNGQGVKRARLAWEKDAPDAPLRVLKRGEDNDEGAQGIVDDDATQAIVDDSSTGLVRRVIYRLEQAPEGPDFATFLAGAAARYSVPVENLSATKLDGSAIDGKSSIDDFEEHFFVNVTQADGEVKQWEFWFEPRGTPRRASRRPTSSSSRAGRSAVAAGDSRH